MNPRRLFLKLLIASVAISALLGIVVLLIGNFGLIEVRILMTTLTVTVVSILGLVCGAYLETGRGKYLPIVGIALSVISAVISFFIIWDVLDDDEMFIKAFLTCTLIATACSHLSLLSLARLDRRFSWTRITAAVCIVLLCAIFLYILWWEPIGGSDLIYRILGILGIVLASITVITPILHKLSSDEGNVAALDREIEKLKEKLRELEAERERVRSTGSNDS